VSNLHEKERECCLFLDEMSVKTSLDYDIRTENFVGDVTLPQHSGTATHALVFVVAGITTRWKQTVSYFFTSNSIDGSVLAGIALDIMS